jgi:hypothetical protein
MLKRLAIVVVLLLAALVINGLVYSKTFVTNPSPLPSFNCIGPQVATYTLPPQTSKAAVKISAGTPLTTETVLTVQEQTCTGQYTAPTFRLVDFIKSWQFYADWLIWSLPLFGIAYIAGSRYAHSRH